MYKRVIMPKNLFQVVDMLNNNNEDNSNYSAPIYIIEEDVANVSRSTFLVNYTVNSTFRTDQRIMFNVTVRDQYDNVRN